ncbi:hypothetical protein ABEV19_19440 [Vibrio parahaemolyticus]
MGDDITPRFDVKEADPSKGGDGVHCQVRSKNINGKHMPDTEAEESAFKVRAWASCIAFASFSNLVVSLCFLWRSLRRATATNPER